MSTISEKEFKKLCDQIYADRLQIYDFVPSLSRRDALMWMLLGCLVSLLSVALPEQSGLDGGSTADPYGDAVCEILKDRTAPFFDPRPHLRELAARTEDA